MSRESEHFDSMNSPTWFLEAPFDVNMAWSEFVLCGTGADAMFAVKKFLDAGLHLPEELVPWVKEACDAWCNTKGNKVLESNRRTRVDWNDAVVEAYVKHLIGMTVRDAIALVAEQRGVNADTLRRNYYDNKHDFAKDTAHIGLFETYERMKEKSSSQMHEQFEKAYPRITNLPPRADALRRKHAKSSIVKTV